LVFLLLSVSLSVSLGIKPASAQTSGYSIQNVNHQIEVMYSGNAIIRDTITISGQTGSFLIGFPYKYGADLLKAEAFSASEVYPMTLGVSLGNQSGFFGVEVTFPEGSPQVFTVAFVLENALLTSTGDNGYSLDFPAYPSLSQAASRCNVTIVLPEGSAVFNITKGDGTILTNNFIKNNLPALAYFPAAANVFIPAALVRPIAITSLDRVVSLDAAGNIGTSASYYIANNSTATIESLKLEVPADAFKLAGKDDFGRDLRIQVLSDSSNPLVLPVNITLPTPIQGGKSARLDLTYSLPRVSASQTRFNLNLELFPDFSYYVYDASVKVVPPEGAHIVAPQLSSIDPYSSLSRDLFQETLQINREGVSSVDREVPVQGNLQVSYDYNLLWLSLRPTVWVWVLASVGVVVAAFLQRPRSKMPSKTPSRKSSVAFSRDRARTFLEVYDERSRVSDEIKSLVEKANRGQMPRRQYKVQRRALELRSDALSKQIAEMKVMFRNAGGNYANLIKQLDIAEADVSNTTANIRSVIARHRKGKIPMDEYKQTLSDLRKRKEKAESAVGDILQKLRQEIR
jgi:hypothetical protein